MRCSAVAADRIRHQYDSILHFVRTAEVSGDSFAERGYDLSHSVWGQLGQRFSLVSVKPRLVSDARVRKVGDDVELVQLGTGRVVMLDPEDEPIVRLFDGSRTIAEVIATEISREGTLDIQRVLGLVDRIMRSEMFENFPPNIFEQLEKYLSHQAVHMSRERNERAASTQRAATAGAVPEEWDPEAAAARLAGVEPHELTNFEQVPWRPRTPLLEERARFLRSVELLRSLDLYAIGALAEAAREEAFPAAHNIINEGEVADRFFIIRSGDVNVTRFGEDGRAHRIAKLGSGDWFGEAGLLDATKRNANVRVGPSRPAQVYSFDTNVFEKFISPHIDQFRGRQVVSRRREKLAEISLFASLSVDDVERLAHAVREVHAPKGTVIFTQGDEASSFYIIAEGSVGIMRDGVPVAKLTAGDFFGETALLFTDARTATVITTENSNLWVIDRAAFEGLVREHLLSRRDMMPTVLNRVSG
jgi:CRP-like cAMP-binding protein